MALQTKDPSTAVISSVGTAVSGGTTSSTKPVITGKADAGNIVVVYDGVRPIGSVTADANGNWTITPTVDLKTGAHNFAAIAQDTAGNFGASSALVNVTITSSAVTPPTPIITDDHGLPIVAGGTTADAKPQISGTGPAGDIITVYDGATPIGSTKINPDGKWTFTPTTDLSNATHAITVTDKVPGGTEGPHSGAAGFTVDTTVPAAPVITAARDLDSGGNVIAPVPTGSTIAYQTVALTGTTTANAVVYVYDGATLLGSSRADGSGVWSYLKTNYSTGTHDLSATVKSAAGVESAHSNHWTFTVDTSTPAKPAAPTVTDDNGASIPAGSTTADALPHIDGKGTPGDTITVLDNDKVIGSTTVKPDGNWSFTPTTDLNNGPHDITVIDTNPAGTSSPASDPTHITVDTSVPDKPATPVLTDEGGTVIPAGSTTNDGHPHISGTGKAGDIIKVYDGSNLMGSVKIGSDGKWTFTPATDLSTGAHSISVTETNAAGTTSPSSDAVPFTYSVVSGAPVIESVVDAVGTITGPIVNGGVTDDSHPTISGKGVAGYTVYIFQNGVGCGDVKVDATGNWTVTLKGALSDGLHVMTATQFIGSGAQSVASNAWTITVDTSVPTKPAAPTLSDDNGLAIPAGSTTADTHPHIDGTGGKAGDTITVYDGGKAIGSTTVNPDGTWSFKPSPDLNPGPHDFTVTDTNPAGTTSPASDPTHITIDTSVPAAPPVPVLTDEGGNLIPAGSTTADAHPYISGKGTAGDIITVYDGATPLGSVKIGTDGNWTFKPTTDLSNAGHSITVTDTNAAGTTGPHSGAVDFTVNTTPAPAITITGVYDHNHALIPDHGSNTGTFTVEGTATGYANGDTVSLYFGGSAVGDVNVIRPQIYNVQIVNGKFSVVLTADTKTGLTGTGGALFSGNAGDITMTALLQNSGHSNKATGNTYTITETSWGASVPAAPVITVVMADDAAWTNPDYMNQSGGTTSHTSEKFAGNGVAGTVVYLYDGATLIGSAAVAQNGTWASNVMTFSNGTHDISATTVSGGVESAHSNHRTFTVNAAPVVVVPTETVTISGLYDDTSGSQVLVNNGGSTKDTTPIVKGDVSHALLSGESLAVYRDGTKVGTATMNGTSWSFNDSGVSVGSHTYTARVENSAGNSAFSGGYSFTEASSVDTYTVSSASFRMTGSTTNFNISGLTKNFEAFCTDTGIVNNRTGQKLLTGSIRVEAYDQSGNYVGVVAYGSSWSPANNGFNVNYTYAFVYRPADGGAPIFLDVRTAATYNYMQMGGTYVGGYQYYNPTTSLASTLHYPAGLKSTLLSATHEDVGSEAALAVVAAAAPDTAPHHTVVNEHEVFKGTTGHDTVDLNADPASYFKDATAHIEGSTAHPVLAESDATGTVAAGVSVPAVNTLHLTGDHQILDLTSLTGKTAAAKISGIEAIDLGGQHNTLKLSLVDVLNLGETDLFMKDGKQQMMVNGKEGDEVDLSNSHIAGLAEGEWQAHGTTQVGGVTYNVYEHSGVHTELLVQQGVQIVVH